MSSVNANKIQAAMIALDQEKAFTGIWTEIFSLKPYIISNMELK